MPKKTDEHAQISPLKTCYAKHTAFQPTGAQWTCPKCGAGAGSTEGTFYVDESPEDADGDCPALHQNDNVVCNGCGGGWLGQNLARKMMQKLDLVPCPCCKGHGVVSKAKAAKEAAKETA